MNRIAVGTRSALLAVAATISIVSATWLPARVLAEQNDRGKDEIPGARGLPEMNPALLQTPLTEPIDISAQPAPGNRLAACHLAGQVTLWVSRPLRVLDDMLAEHSMVEAGLLQFGAGTTLEGCVPDSATLDLSNQFANFLVAPGGAYHGETVTALASQLAQEFFHLAQPDGTPVPLVDGIKVGAVGSVAHEYTVVLIRDGRSASFDAVIHRETVRTKFSPRLPEVDRRLSRVRWSSAQHD